MLTAENTEALPKPQESLLLASTRFWFCNVLAWLTFNLAEGLRNSVDGTSLLDNFIGYFPTAIAGMVTSGLVRYLYKKNHWQYRHPIQLVPIAAISALTFGLINIWLNYPKLVLSITEICSRNYARPPNSCGMLSDLFLQSMGAMLIWCLFYFLISAERYTKQNVNYKPLALVKALLCLVFLSYLGTHLSVLAWIEWGENYYLYSKPYFLNALSLCLPLLSTLYILFIPTRSRLWGSTTIPLIPLLFVISLCCTALNIGGGGAIFRLFHLPENWTIRFLLFGEAYGNFSHPNYLAGVIDGTFVNTLATTVFYLSCRFKAKQSKECEGESHSEHKVTHLKLKRLSTQWGGYFLFWMVFALLIYATDIIGWKFFGDSVMFTHIIAFTFFGAFIGAMLRQQMLYFSEEPTSLARLSLKIVTASLYAGVLLSSSIWLFSYGYILIVLDGRGIDKYSSFVAMDGFVLANILSTCVLCGLWSFICYTIESMRQHRESAIHQLQLEANMKEVQLNALAGRLDPHFIFNALNNIRALVNEDKEKARTAIAILSDILRRPIADNSQDKVSLQEELVLIRNYISLAQIQFEERLEYHENISEDGKQALIPSMMLQILVENAIKHGISQLPDGGTIQLDVLRSEDNLMCVVKNSGFLKTSSQNQGFGVGLKSLHDRLSLLYSGEARFGLRQVEDCVEARLVFPYEVAP